MLATYLRSLTNTVHSWGVAHLTWDHTPQNIFLTGVRIVPGRNEDSSSDEDTPSAYKKN